MAGRKKLSFSKINKIQRNEQAKKKKDDKIKTDKVLIKGHRLPGVFTSEGGIKVVLTRMIEGDKNLYYSKQITAHGDFKYQTWDPFRSKLAAAVLSGIDKLYLRTGNKVLYIGWNCISNLCHVSDIIGPDGIVYAPFSKSKPDILQCSIKRKNIYPFAGVNDYLKFSPFIALTDVMIWEMTDKNYIELIADYARLYLKDGGHLLLYVDANKINKDLSSEIICAEMCQELLKYEFSILSQISLANFYKNSTYLTLQYRPLKR